jgi:hypothetical protein
MACDARLACVIGWHQAANALDSWFDAFSLREPVSTSLENALISERKFLTAEKAREQTWI